MKKIYVFKKIDSGIQGKAFEMAIKDALKRKNPDCVSSCGKADFRYYHKNYDTKQNGSVLQYNPNDKYIKGSNRVIYATHIDYSIEWEQGDEIGISVDLLNTQMFVVDKTEFVEFLLENGKAKQNLSRGTVNIQTCYNYKKNAYHGKTGKLIEAWAYENEIDDDIIDHIIEGLI